MNLKKLRTEDKFLLCCATTQIDSDTVTNIKSIVSIDLDWEYIIKMATKHKLRPLLYWQLNKICFEGVPDQIMDNLKDYFNHNTRKNLLMFSELIKIMKLLESCGIVTIPYKGPVLAILAYKDIVFREFNDLDFFVQFKDVSKAINALIENDYKPLFTSKKDKLLFYNKFGRDLPFKSESNIKLEIQWTFASLIFSFKDEPEFFFRPKPKKIVEYGNFEIKTILNEELFLVLCIHNASHYWSSISLICDISELIKSDRSINWSKIFQNAEIMGIKRILIINLILVRELLNTELPKNIFDVIQSDESALVIADQIVGRFFSNDRLKMCDKIFFHAKIREKYQNKIKDLIFLLFIPTPNVIESVSLPTSLFPLYILIRVIESVHNIFKQWKKN